MMLPPARPQGNDGNGNVSPVGQRILNALAELRAMRVPSPSRELVAMLVGYSHMNSKGFSNALGSLRTGGYIDYPGRGTIALTSSGERLARPPAVLTTPRQVQERVMALLGGASARILEPLIQKYPHAMPREDLAAEAGYGHMNSKGFANAIGRLRSLGFIDYPSTGLVKAQPVLFLEER